MGEEINMKGLSRAEEDALLPPGLVLAGYRGSVAHGMYVPDSDPLSIDDKDLMGVYIGPIEQYYGLKALWKPKPWEKMLREWDVVCYELRQYVYLLLKSNPNVMALLWLDPKHYTVITSAGQQLIDNRHLFASKHAYRSFTGYAHGQLHKMTHHAFEGYMGEKRKRLVEQFGYDTKNAAHLIRLLRMGIEFLTDGALYVERHDAQQLLEIKRGEWSLEQVKTEATRLFAQTEEAYMHSALPETPDAIQAEQLLVTILLEHFR